mmetsp:Transcript_14027/g.41795  ORF Transcript_14027/g.41795 Transcript_14027/m.41795 type:complete len:261 (+) Transcript_14027:176-958(+)
MVDKERLGICLVAHLCTLARAPGLGQEGRPICVGVDRDPGFGVLLLPLRQSLRQNGNANTPNDVLELVAPNVGILLLFQHLAVLGHIHHLLSEIEPEGIPWNGCHQVVADVSRTSPPAGRNEHLLTRFLGKEEYHLKVPPEERGRVTNRLDVQVCVDSAKTVEVEDAGGKVTLDVRVVAVVCRQEPGVIILDQGPVVIVSPQLPLPTRRVGVPRLVVMRECCGQLLILVCLVDHQGNALRIIHHAVQQDGGQHRPICPDW